MGIIKCNFCESKISPSALLNKTQIQQLLDREGWKQFEKKLACPGCISNCQSNNKK